MSNTELATAPGGAVAAYDYGEDAGVGFEGTKPGDFKPSFLRILQSNSPQVVNEMPGAKAGLIIDNITSELFKEVTFIPAVRDHVYVAWKPRNQGGGEGQGFGGVYQPDDKLVLGALAKIENKFERGEDGKIILPETPDGEFQLIETVYWHGVQVLDESGAAIPVTVPMSSTNMPVAGSWYTTMRRQIIPGTSKPFPLFAHAFRLGSNKVTKKNNTWFMFTTAWVKGTAADSRLDPQGDLYQSARSVATAFKEGNAKVDYASAGQGDAAPAGGGNKSSTTSDAAVPF